VEVDKEQFTLYEDIKEELEKHNVDVLSDVEEANYQNALHVFVGGVLKKLKD
jgi:hypothetical protein